MVLAEVEILQAANGTNQPQEEGGVHFFVNDHLMPPQMAVNHDNVVTWQAEYTSFGKTDISVEQFVNNHRFPGQYYDAESGLYYNWNRYYDSNTGRYFTSDPIGLGGGLNTFGYVNGNPLIYADPNGLCPAGGLFCGTIIAIGSGIVRQVGINAARREAARRLAAQGAAGQRLFVLVPDLAKGYTMPWMMVMVFLVRSFLQIATKMVSPQNHGSHGDHFQILTLQAMMFNKAILAGQGTQIEQRIVELSVLREPWN